MSRITTHILDTARGAPASAVDVVLYQRDDDGWRRVGGGVSDEDGRVAELMAAGAVAVAGVYKLRFNTGAYFKERDLVAFYPFVEVVFQVTDDGRHYHVPLLLNPFGYSTYRGS